MLGLRMASCFTIVVLSCALPSRVWAQQASGIAGAVTDPSGAVLPGVTVEAASPALIERIAVGRHRQCGAVRDRRFATGDLLPYVLPRWV